MDIPFILSAVALAAALPGLGALAYRRMRRRQGLDNPFVPEPPAAAAAAHIANTLRDAKQYGPAHPPPFPEEAKRGVEQFGDLAEAETRVAAVLVSPSQEAAESTVETLSRAYQGPRPVLGKPGWVEGTVEQLFDPRTQHHPEDLLHDAVERSGKARMHAWPPRRVAPEPIPQRDFPPSWRGAPWMHDAIFAVLPRELVVDLGEQHGLIICEVNRIPHGTLGGPAGIVAHGIQRLLRDACAGGTVDDAVARLEEWYRGVRNVRRRRTGGRRSIDRT